MKYIPKRFELSPLEEIDLSKVDLSGGISIFVPAYNEEDNIERAIRNSVEVLESITDNYEMLVVNDASTDRTREIVENLAVENDRIKIINHEKNTRLGGAIKTGFTRTTKDIVFYCDADNPIDMWDVKRALPLMADYDLVAGFRLQREERFYRLIYSFVYNTMVGLLFGIESYDINFSFKLVKRSILNKIELNSTGGFIDVEFIVEALLQKARICRVGLRYFPRTAGVSTMASFPVILKILKEMWIYYKKFRKKRKDKS